VKPKKSLSRENFTFLSSLMAFIKISTKGRHFLGRGKKFAHFFLSTKLPKCDKITNLTWIRTCSSVDGESWPFISARVTGWVCEKNRPKSSPNRFLSKWIHYFFPWKKRRKNFDSFCKFHITGQRKQLPTRRKFVQSGHPAFHQRLRWKVWRLRKLSKKLTPQLDKKKSSGADL
jgi:hypothetical protein